MLRVLLASGAMPGEVLQLRHAAQQHVQRPGRARREIEDVSRREAERDGEIVAEIALALAAHRQVAVTISVS